MKEQILTWFKKPLQHPEFLVLLGAIIVIGILLMFVGQILTPILISLIIAYLLNSVVVWLERFKCPHLLAVSIVCIFLLGVLAFFLLVVLPMLWQQSFNLLTDLPKFLKLGENFLLELPHQYPDFISDNQIQKFLVSFETDLGKLGKLLLAHSVATITSVITLIVYLVLVPLIVFFLLKDRDRLLVWFGQFMPKKRRLISEVWEEVDRQIGNYIKAKVLELLIVGATTIVFFSWMGLRYSVLLGTLVGLSVLIPYIGVTIVTIPVLIVAYLQWGWTPDFAYLVIIYFIIMLLDGNVLTTILFSETMKIHPVGVIFAIIFFGGIWGFWGVFFALPLAVAVKAVLDIWLRLDGVSSAEKTTDEKVVAELKVD